MAKRGETLMWAVIAQKAKEFYKLPGSPETAENVVNAIEKCKGQCLNIILQQLEAQEDYLSITIAFIYSAARKYVDEDKLEQMLKDFLSRHKEITHQWILTYEFIINVLQKVNDITMNKEIKQIAEIDRQLSKMLSNTDYSMFYHTLLRFYHNPDVRQLRVNESLPLIVSNQTMLKAAKILTKNIEVTKENAISLLRNKLYSK